MLVPLEAEHAACMTDQKGKRGEGWGKSQVIKIILIMKINVFTETRHHAEREGDPGQRDQQGAEDDGPRRARPVRHQDQVSY